MSGRSGRGGGLLRAAAHGAAFVGAFVAGYASGAELELSIVARALVIAAPIAAAAVVTWSAPADAGGRTIVRGVILAAGAGFGLGYGLGSINGSDPMPFMYGA